MTARRRLSKRLGCPWMQLMPCLLASDACLGPPVDIDASVLRELKKQQRQDHKPLGQLISELLAKAIEAEAEPPRPFIWVTKDLRPRIDLDDKDALWSILDKQ